MAASDITAVAAIYKRKYSDDKFARATKRDHLLQEKLTIRQGCGGADFRYLIVTGNPQGISGTFTTAQTGASSSKTVQLATSPALKYAVITLDGPSMARSRGSDNAFVELVTLETDGAIEEMGDSLAFDLYHDGSGQRGRRSSASTNVITLTVADDARNFKRGMTVIASANADGSSARSGSTTVASVDEDAGTVTLTSAAGISSFGDNDYLFRAGDPATCVEGLAAHFPLAAPSASESFRGIDRSVDVARLAGARVDDTATTIEENCGLVGVKIRQRGKRANAAFWNPINFWTVVRRANAKVEFDSVGGEAGYGFEYFFVDTPAGRIKAYSDPDCPTNRQYVVSLDALQIRAIDDYVHIIRDDQRPSMRQTTADGIEIRARSMGQLVCTDPACCGVASI